MIAHNLNVDGLIKILKKLPCKFVDAYVEDNLTLVFRPSDFQGEEDEGDVDVKDTIV